jgi:hypothetical protein
MSAPSRRQSTPLLAIYSGDLLIFRVLLGQHDPP